MNHEPRPPVAGQTPESWECLPAPVAQYVVRMEIARLQAAVFQRAVSAASGQLDTITADVAALTAGCGRTASIRGLDASVGRIRRALAGVRVLVDAALAGVAVAVDPSPPPDAAAGDADRARAGAEQQPEPEAED